jgi:uncharacterized protein YjdB
MKRLIQFVGFVCIAFVFACKTDQFTDVDNGKSNFFYIKLTPEAASLAIGQQQQLTVTAYDGECGGAPCNPFTPGNVVNVEGVPTYRSTDTTKAKVSSSGVVTGIAAGSASIIATLQDIPGFTDSKSVTRADTTIVTVTATPVAVASIQLAGRASAPANTVGAGSTLALTTTITNTAGAAVTNVGRPQYYSSNPAIATVSTTGTVTGAQPGNATIMATITVGGTTKTATFDVVVTPATSATFSITPATSGTGIIFFPNTITVSATQAKVEGKAGATVSFAVTSGTFSATTTPNNTQCFNVTFANPGGAAAVAPSTNSGNIGVGQAGSSDPPLCSGTQSRLFATPGTYTFTSTTNGATGTLIVQ